MYSKCLLVVFLIIQLCCCTLIKLSAPDISSKTQKDTTADLISIQAAYPIPSPNQQTIPGQQNEPVKSFSVILTQEASFVAANTPELTPTTTEDDCCGYYASEKAMERSLTDISQEKNDTEILNQIYILIDNISFSTQKVVDNLSFAVYVPNATEKSDEDTIWRFREQNSNDEIDIKLHHDIVNHMESEFIYFKIALLKHYSHSSFSTTTKNGRLLKHGPFIIVKTTSENEISTGAPALEFKIDRNQLEHPKGKWNCRFWNNQTQEWEKRGVQTIKDDKYFTCISNHLSAFSVVMDPYAGTEDDDAFLTFISVLGSLVTIPCLIITILLYRHKRTRRKKISSKILINCCLSLSLLHVSFLIFTFFQQNFPCWLMNFLVHYGVSSALLWTAADGINMWRKLFVDIFDKRKTIFYRWSKIISWGFPLITSSLGILETDYTERDECGIYFKHNLLLYLLPGALIMICNVIFFTIMFTNVVCKNKIKSLTARKKKYVMSLVQVFGLFWCIAFPLLWLGETRLLGHIVFTVLVANQGIVIFIVRCMNEREIRSELLEYTLYRKIFHRVLTITDEKSYTVNKHGRSEVTGIFAVSSGSGKCILSSSDMDTRL